MIVLTQCCQISSKSPSIVVADEEKQTAAIADRGHYLQLAKEARARANHYAEIIEIVKGLMKKWERQCQPRDMEEVCEALEGIDIDEGDQDDKENPPKLTTDVSTEGLSSHSVSGEDGEEDFMAYTYPA